MNKKGFTLIELLATIMILALIMLVAVPNVMSTIDKNKQSTYVEDARRMITLAEYELRSDTSIPTPTNGNCVVILLRALDLSEFDQGPEGGDYDIDSSYVVIARSGNKNIYMAALVENYDGGRRGVPLSTRSDLNKENAIRLVAKDSDLNIPTPTVGSKVSGYTVTKIVNS